MAKALILLQLPQGKEKKYIFFPILTLYFFSNSEITSNLKSDEIVISDGEDCELQNNAQEVLIVNESSVSEVNLQQPDNSPNPLNDHAAENEVVIMEEEMAVDLSITSKNITAEGKYFLALSGAQGVALSVCMSVCHFGTLLSIYSSFSIELCIFKPRFKSESLSQQGNLISTGCAMHICMLQFLILLTSLSVALSLKEESQVLDLKKIFMVSQYPNLAHNLSKTGINSCWDQCWFILGQILCSSGQGLTLSIAGLVYLMCLQRQKSAMSWSQLRE